MKRRLIYSCVIVVLAIDVLIGGRVYLNSAEAAQKDNPYPNLELFSVVMEKVRKDYVDGQNLTYKDLVYGALKGMVETLDPHSEFMDPQEYKELQNDTEGHFGGLGILVGIKDNFLTVNTPMDGGPGFKAGIISGDRIIKIDGKSTEKMSLEEAVKSLRGDAGTDVNITILRPASNEIKDFKLTRAIINVDMVVDINGKKEFPLDESKIGYIRIVEFGDKTADNLETAIKKLKGQGMHALILDLRWNPGGLLDQAVEVCGKFLPHRQLIVTTEGRNPAQNSERRSEGRGDELINKNGSQMPMVVLVNLGSASASEIVAGCLQDLHRAIIIGEKTFGKGSVQSILPLPPTPDGPPALKLTTAKYYTPSHKVIHEHGITPDRIVPLTAEEERDVQLRHTIGGIESLDEKEQKRLKEEQDPQLERSMDLLKAITLYSQRASAPQKAAAEKNEKVAVK